MERTQCREIFGTLLYLSTRTIPYIGTAVSLIGKKNESPAPRHGNTIRFVIRFLVGTVNFCVLIERGSEKFSIQVYSNADCGRDKGQRKSRSGFSVSLNGCPVLWMSKKQTIVSLSTAEAELIALSSCIRDASRTRGASKELLGFCEENTTKIFPIFCLKWKHK